MPPREFPSLHCQTHFPAARALAFFRPHASDSCAYTPPPLSRVQDHGQGVGVAQGHPGQSHDAHVQGGRVRCARREAQGDQVSATGRLDSGLREKVGPRLREFLSGGQGFAKQVHLFYRAP